MVESDESSLLANRSRLLINSCVEGLVRAVCRISNQLGIGSISAVRDVHYVHAERPEEFAAEIIKYLGDKEGRERIGRAGRRLILDHYTWSQVATSYLDLISQALAARSQSVQANIGSEH